MKNDTRLKLESDQELQKRHDDCEHISSVYTKGNGWKLFATKFLDLNLNQFYDEFLSDSPKFGFDLLAVALGHSDINLNPWKKN